MNRTYYDITAKSLNKKGEELCGDKVEIIHAGDDTIVVLSDGLGSGVKANILATLTSKIIATMMQAGASLEDTVNTIVHTLPVCKIRQIAYSTFSILKITSDGKAFLTEFDSPNCLYFRHGVSVPIPYTTRTIEGKTVREAELSLEYGDVLTLISDGVMYAGLGEILNLGWNWDNINHFLEERLTSDDNNTSSARLTEALIGACADLYLNAPGDDTTVATITAVPRQDVSILSGPPEHPEHDEVVFNTFINQFGTKVVCGGSTANMAARLLNQEVITNLQYKDNLPPLGHIKGIDLVTEGVLTIRKANSLVTDYLKDPSNSAILRQLDKPVASSMLAKLLIEHCTHLHLYIGKAINPAHQNPNLPVDLSIKIRLLEELADTLTKAGKQVDVSYC
ncbi:MAG: SpoIIE family protein phosphatase [Oscillospiraceae bacterium]